MYLKFLLFIIFFIFYFSIYSQNKIDSIIPETAFKIGETLKYEIRYSFIKGGEASISIDLKKIGYNFYYHIVAKAQTSGIADKFFTIRDVYESYADIVNVLPIKSIRNIHEENYRRYNEVLFDRKKNKVYSLKSGEHEVPANILDLLSAFYYARSFVFKNLKKNQIIELNTFFDEEILLLKLRYKKKEKVKTKFGKIECLLFVPVIEKESFFRKEKDLKIWVTNEKNLVPIKIRANLFFGTAKCDLIEFENLKYKDF